MLFLKYMAIKQTFRQRPGLFEEGKIDTEARMLSLFNHLRCDRSNIIRLKHHINFPLQEIHRLYLEYCPHGDLFTLAMRYKRWRRYFPEPFLWHLFHQLSKAVLLMQKGNLPKDEEDPPAPRYQDIVIDRLKALCSERNLVFKSKILKRQLVELLENDDRTRAHRKEEEKAKNLIDETPVRAHWKEIGELAGLTWLRVVADKTDTVHRDIRPLNSESFFPLAVEVLMICVHEKYFWGSRIQIVVGGITHFRNWQTLGWLFRRIRGKRATQMRIKDMSTTSLTLL